MRFRSAITVMVCAAAAALGQESPPKEAQPILPRLAPSDYQAQAKAGSVTIAADFVSHSVPTPLATFTTSDFVVVEAAVFGPPEARLTLSIGDFSLRINDKKSPVPSQPVGLVMRSLKDPSWEPPPEEKKSKGSMGGGGNQNDPPPAPAKMPFALQRVMEQRVQKTVMLEGERPLPQAGLLFFPYAGKATSIKSVELIYNGPAGTATLTLQP